MNKETKIVVIPRDQAVFRMDAEGRWHNDHGPFENPKISAYFHRSIHHDADGFFLQQTRDDVIEKVYFPVADTAFFVFRVDVGEAVSLTLNTGRTLVLNPEHLFIENDRLYLADGDARIKFTAAAAMKLAPFLEDGDTGPAFHFGGRRTAVTERTGGRGD